MYHHYFWAKQYPPIFVVILGLLFTSLLTIAWSSEIQSAIEIESNSAANLVVDDTVEGLPIADSLRGSNLPTWLGPARITDPTVYELATVADLTVMRMPGGSWSNGYDWRSCEVDYADGCWNWAARPRDYIKFLRATSMAGMFTVNPNGTSKEAAALVAFFNGSQDDDSIIGVDVRGYDWGTVGEWAQLRTDTGSPEPLYVKYWEIGNELYGGKLESGTDCTAWGWEDVWTCDGTEYVTGIGSGEDRHEGFLEFRTAMEAVDPTIMVGAVGVPFQESWNNWGNEVIAAAGSQMDFYSIHHYGFFNPPDSPAEALAAPIADWPRIMDDIRSAFDEHADGRDVPIAVTEYILFSAQEKDTEQWMTRMTNALYMADSLGQMASQGIEIATQWNYANGQANNGTDYGMIHADTYARYPQYFVFPLWSKFGQELVPVENPLSAETELSVYAARGSGDQITILAINKTGQALEANISMASGKQFIAGEVDVLQAESLDAQAVTFNGNDNPDNDLADAPSIPLTELDTPLNYTFAPYSVTLLSVTLAEPEATPTPQPTATPANDFRVLLPIIDD